MVVVTESGSQYRIFDGICRKFDKDGIMVDIFKVWVMKGINLDALTWQDLHESKDKVEVGKRMYIAGSNVWWITTPVEAIY